MGEYADLNGVRTYYQVHGTSNEEPLVLLHGGLATAETWGPQIAALSERYRVYVPERRAHGHTQDVEGPVTYEDMAADTVAFLKEIVSGPAHLVGWSDGGIVGLLVALGDPDLVRKLIVVGTNFHYEGVSVTPQDMGMSADGPEMASLRSLYEAASPDGPEHWPVVFDKVIRMWTTSPTMTVGDVARIVTPTLVLVGDDDMPRLSHTTAMFEALPNGQLAVVPGASHTVPMEKPRQVNQLILEFLSGGEPQTMIPIRRRRRGA
jgi:pimeloyl-ACP methyl ester carboxylesterase